MSADVSPITGEELAALVVTALPNAEKVTIIEIGESSVVFDWRGYGFSPFSGETLRFQFFGKTAKDFTVMQYVKMSPMSRKPPAWTNATDLCVLMRALFRQRWSPYVRREYNTDLQIATDEPADEPTAKVIQMSHA
ncbi:hypothetical protein MUN82_08845 [Hymenobacter aerilatus]|uniref:Uncharacterized protein n=1 Tax=Hymenobacter aerilatus TaxID=2932251 RepID=A0A8T9T3L7_9BACT|nr:hypothetical protein [Hymenobacter aerilatus]UOR07190.1 hypothetical protein MUN82_08845 [Hymenobacter aerilatus]